MKKQLTITETKEGLTLKNEGFSPVELMGVLRFYEKDVWLMMQNRQQEKTKSTTNP